MFVIRPGPLARAVAELRRGLVARYRARWGEGGVAARLRGPSERIAENGDLIMLECERPADCYLDAFKSAGSGPPVGRAGHP